MLNNIKSTNQPKSTVVLHISQRCQKYYLGDKGSPSYDTCQVRKITGTRLSNLQAPFILIRTSIRIKARHGIYWKYFNIDYLLFTIVFRPVAWGFCLGGQIFRRLYNIFAWWPFSLRFILILENSGGGGGNCSPPAPFRLRPWYFIQIVL